MNRFGDPVVFGAMDTNVCLTTTAPALWATLAYTFFDGQFVEAAVGAEPMTVEQLGYTPWVEEPKEVGLRFLVMATSKESTNGGLRAAAAPA